jgi:Ca2+-transporting ATPase
MTEHPPRGDVTGLSAAAVAERLNAEGPNELPRPPRRTPFRIVWDVVREPMFGLLLAAGVIYFVLGDPEEAAILTAFATLSVSIAVVQESRTERVLEALRDLTSPRALVIRDGEQQRIPGRDVVRGDLLVVAEGDRVAADAILLSGQGVQTDESLLTGESVPVRKRVVTGAPPAAIRPGGDDLPYLYSGTMVVAGQGVAEVRATGAHSEIGRIGLALGEIEAEPPRLTVETRKLVRAVAAIGLVLSAVAVVLFGLFRGGWLDALLAGIALVMSMLPEEFPLVLTVFMAMGAWRISQARVLTRRAAAIETLGAATVLCTDKTGTLTQNRMSIAELRVDERSLTLSAAGDTPLADPFAALVEYGILASKVEPFDPMEKAFHALAGRLSARRHPRDGLALVREYALSPDLLAMSNVWRVAGEDGLAVATKGAPEAVARLCRLPDGDLERVRRTIDDMGRQGMRVLGVACGTLPGTALPATQEGFALSFVGLVGLADPLRPSVPQAVEECRTAGIRVVMITGDYPATAEAIARRAGLAAANVVAGDELAHMTDAALAQRVRTATVFARIMPEQKLRIVNALKSNGEVVAMTGDGVNDAPSLKAAHIGVAMGGRGTDVAREASSIVLLDDDFASIVKTVRLGRRIYDNLRKAMGYILAVHVPIAGMALLPLITGWPLVFGPIHIAFLEMVIDPVCSIVFEAEGEETDVMRRPPRAPDGALFSWALVGWSMVQGFVAFAVVAAVYVLALHRGMPDDEVRALTFVSLVLTNMALIFVNRSFSASLTTAIRRANRVLWAVLAAAAALLALALEWPAARETFRFGPLHADDLTICAAAGIGVLLALDAVKPLWRQRLET